MTYLGKALFLADLGSQLNGLMTVTRSVKERLPRLYTACGTTVSRRIWRLPGAAGANHTHCICVQSQRYWRRVLHKIRQTENRFAYCYMAKLAIDSDRLESQVLNKSGDLHTKSGDFHYFIKNREISRQIERLGTWKLCLCALMHDYISYLRVHRKFHLWWCRTSRRGRSHQHCSQNPPSLSPYVALQRGITCKYRHAVAVFCPGLKKGTVLLGEKGHFCSRNYILRALSRAELFSEGTLHKLWETYILCLKCNIMGHSSVA